MTEIIIFRFHRDFPVCEQTVRQLRRLNPDIQIHGLFGGQDSGEIPQSLLALLDSNWVIPMEDSFYKWKNGDLCARLWFKAHGHALSFSHAYFLEWDMLFTRPLSEVYGTLDDDTNYTTFFGDYDHVQKTDWWWLTGHYGMETSWLLDLLAGQGQVVDLTNLNYGYMGGAVFCRKFLELYACTPVPSYSNDELRMSVYSKAFDIPLRDNGISKNAEAHGNMFCAENHDLTMSEFNAFMAGAGAVLHPLRFIVDNIDNMITALRPA